MQASTPAPDPSILSAPQAPPSLPLSLADFELIKRLGDGSYSQVVLARMRATGQEYALKVIDKHHILRHGAVDSVRRERAILGRLTDPGVVRLHFTFQDALSLYLGLEYCPGGEVYEQVRARGRLDPGDARFYAAELVLVLQALRAAGVVHRDVKPENLLLDAAGHLKLIDFGSAKELPAAASPAEQAPACAPSAEPADGPQQAEGNGTEATPAAGGIHGRRRAASLVGTADYVSPEVLHSRPVTPAADLWALGCVLYHMLSGRPPFKSNSEYLTFQKVIAGDYDPLPPEVATKEAADLVARLLRVDPGERLGAGDLEELKAHPFFAGVEWATLREGPAPELLFPDGDSLGSAASSFDWELQSLAAALPHLPRGVNSIDLDPPPPPPPPPV